MSDNNNVSPQSQYWFCTLFGDDRDFFFQETLPNWEENGLPQEIMYVAYVTEPNNETHNTHTHLYIELTTRRRRNKVRRMLQLEHTDVRPRDGTRENVLYYLSEINNLHEIYRNQNTRGYGAITSGTHRDLFASQTFNGRLYNLESRNISSEPSPLSPGPIRFIKTDVKYYKNKKHPKKISEEVATAIRNGNTYDAIWHEFPGFTLLHSQAIKRLIYDFNEKKRVESPVVIYIWGETGLGKTYTAKKLCELGPNKLGDGSYYLKNSDIKWYINIFIYTSVSRLATPPTLEF
ncbi:hypothetical protein WA158_003545 [Blastocystis sp. Blastoise]